MSQDATLERHFKAYGKQLDEVFQKLSEKVSTQIITQLPAEIMIRNIDDEVRKLTKSISKENKQSIKEASEVISKAVIDALTQTPEWKLAEGSEVAIKGGVKIKDTVTVKDDGTVLAALTALFASLAGLLTRLANRTVRMIGTAEHYTTPQFVMLVDPATGAPVRPDDIGKAPAPGFGMGGTAIAASGGPTHVGARGADEFNDGTKTVTTAGTAVQLATDTECFSVTIQAHPDNTGDVVVGGPNVVAATAGRRGLSLLNTQWATFRVSNLNQIWLDATQDGDKVNYFYER